MGLQEPIFQNFISEYFQRSFVPTSSFIYSFIIQNNFYSFWMSIHKKNSVEISKNINCLGIHFVEVDNNDFQI